METSQTTMKQLGDAIHVERQTVSNYALGQSSPDWETLRTICEYFGVSADFLIGLSDVPRKGMTIREIVAIDEIVDALDSASKRLKDVLAKEEP